MVFATVHSQSADAIFKAAAARDMRLIAGKVLMDRNCPDELRDDPKSAYEDSKQLIERWHGKGRLGYAITPRFAVTSTEEQLEMSLQSITFTACERAGLSIATEKWSDRQ